MAEHEAKEKSSAQPLPVSDLPNTQKAIRELAKKLDINEDDLNFEVSAKELLISIDQMARCL